jgi:hypothetical protein
MKEIRLILTVTIVIVMVVSGWSAVRAQPPPGESVCFEFEQLVLGQKYVVGDAFSVTGADVEAREFEWSPSRTTADGLAMVQDTGLSGGIGYEIGLNNINLSLKLYNVLTGLTLLYGEYGGNVNLEVNGDFANLNDFMDINGGSLGNVTIYVDDFGNSKGRLRFEGEVEQFAIGGQELWIDDPCGIGPSPGCVTFESLKPDSTFAVGDTFSDAGVQLFVREFQWSNGIWTADGKAVIDTGGKAGGTGNDLNTNNVNIGFEFGRPVQSVYFRFGEYGGNLNLEVNGDWLNFANFADIHGLMVGQVMIMATNGYGNDQGMVALIGPIQSFAVGGQELWLDDVCYCAGPETRC